MGDLASLLVRLGLRTLGAVAALSEADLVARFGPDGGLAWRRSRGLDDRPLEARDPPADLTVEVVLDPPADRVDTAAFAARTLAADLHDRLDANGLACTRLTIEALTTDGLRLSRVWRHEGRFTPGATAERVRWQLDGWLTHEARAQQTEQTEHRIRGGRDGDQVRTAGRVVDSEAREAEQDGGPEAGAAGSGWAPRTGAAGQVGEHRTGAAGRGGGPQVRSEGSGGDRRVGGVGQGEVPRTGAAGQGGEHRTGAAGRGGGPQVRSEGPGGDRRVGGAGRDGGPELRAGRVEGSEARAAARNAELTAVSGRHQDSAAPGDVGGRAEGGGLVLLRLVPEEVVAGGGRQLGFWGGDAEADERAARALARVQGLLGPAAVVTAVPSGGRAPRLRATLVPWGDPREPVRPGGQAKRAAIELGPVPALEGRSGPGSSALEGRSGPGSSAGDLPDLTEVGGVVGRRRPKRTMGAAAGEVPPWPGRIPGPPPAVVPAEREPAEVVDASGAAVTVSGRGLASAAPARVAWPGGTVEVEGWAGPWPVEERWWDPAAAARLARIQVSAADGTALLLACESGAWWLEAVYD